MSGGTDSGYPSSNMAKPSVRNMGPLNFPGPQTVLFDSGGAGNSSSDMRTQVPGAGSRLPRSSESTLSIPPTVKFIGRVFNQSD